ncbi:LysR family transcriptional regulator [Sphingobium scionense]|nr:LysR family transcriptional regulator [Sphingobium scionense]
MALSRHAALSKLCRSPSAISRRVKALEERLGRILIVRGQPCTPPAWAGRFAPI